MTLYATYGALLVIGVLIGLFGSASPWGATLKV